MRINPALIVLILGVMMGTGETSYAKPSPYVLGISEPRKAAGKRVIWLRNTKTKRVLWARKIDNSQFSDDSPANAFSTWSKDRKAVAVEAVVWQMLVWREGYRLRNFRIPGDYTMGTVWSPDNRRLLVITGISADSDVGAGALYCLTIGRWPYYRWTLIDSGVRQMIWKNNRTVAYWKVKTNANGPFMVKKPRFWRVTGR